MSRHAIGHQLVAATPPLWKIWRSYKAHRLRLMCRTFDSHFGLVVRNGPFKGLKYLPESVGSALLPKLLGSYEHVLHPILAGLLTNRYSGIIDIGCAEGYYAVGLAQCCPETPVVAFDSDPVARELCKTLAALNAVDHQVTVAGTCTPESLGAAIRARSLIVCDCEGDEARLLDPARVSGLENCDLIVELHPHLDRNIPDLIDSRFLETHSVELVHGRHEANSMEDLKVFKWRDRKLATYEERSGAQPIWAVLRAKAYWEGAVSPRGGASRELQLEMNRG